MADETNDITGTFSDWLARYGTMTGTPTTYTHEQIEVQILEMEDVLFHLDSAVMMPERPEGQSSTQGVGDDATDAQTQQEQEQASGLAALALAYRQFEFDREKRLLIAGHTDTSGAAQMNFELSALRAQGVQFLIEGNREEWAALSAGRHRIEDYQQILTFANSRMGWDCDPLGVDDRWGDNTRYATNAFIEKYNLWVLAGLAPAGSEQIPGNVMAQIVNHGQHKWPIEMWRAVFDLYIDELARVLGVARDEMGWYRALVGWVNDEKKYVACGESFPLDNVGRDNYRSQLNRRVELLFFNQNQAPEINCPTRTTSVHTPAECPIWHSLHFIPVHIDPADLTAIAYHLKFVYFDRLSETVKAVPDGLDIKVYDQNGPISAVRKRYRDGVYQLKIQDDAARTSIHFEIEMPNKWLFVPVDSEDAQIADATAQTVMGMPLTEQKRYYDLPAKWSSINYWTRFDHDHDSGMRFRDMIDGELQMKPFGGEASNADSPMVFSFDDIVLLDAVGGTQDIKDCDHSLPPVNKELAEKSRAKLLYSKPNHHLALYCRDFSDQKTARIPFRRETIGGNTVYRNLFVEQMEYQNLTRIVHFRDGFYPVGHKRTVEEPGWQEKLFVVGARAAIRSDADYHRMWVMGGDAVNQEFSFSGDYELHYFHHLELDAENPVSYLIPYISISFLRDTRPAGTADVDPKPTGVDVLKFVDEGMYNAMDRWNLKEFFFDETSPDTVSERVHLFFFFDERETFVISDANTPNNIDWDPDVDAEPITNNAAVSTARANALGGKSIFLAVVCADQAPGFPYGAAYQHQRRKWGRTYSFFRMNRSAYHDVGTIGDVGATVTELGDTIGVFTLAHEIGHAIGNADEYFYREFAIVEPIAGGGTQRHIFGSYRRDFECYSMQANKTSMMKGNVAPRLHQLWYYLYKLNAEIAAGSIAAFHPAGRRFNARLVRGGVDLTYHRGVFTIQPDNSRRLTLGSHQVPTHLTRPMAIDAHFNIPGVDHKQLRLSLFHVGPDLSSRRGFHLNQNDLEYQAVLTIGVLMEVEWDDDDGNWTEGEKATILSRVQAAWLDRSGKYRLIGGTRGIQRIFIHFVPGFKAAGDNDDLNNYRTQFRRSQPSGTNPRITFHSPLIGADKLRIHRNATMTQIQEYLLHIASGQDHLVALDYIRDWVNAQTGDNFTMERIV